jgi:hypothetical protein
MMAVAGQISWGQIMYSSLRRDLPYLGTEGIPTSTSGPTAVCATASLRGPYKTDCRAIQCV